MAEELNPTTGGEGEPKPTEANATGGSQETIEKKEGGDNTPLPPKDGDEPAIPVRQSAQDFIHKRRSDRLAKIEKDKKDTGDEDGEIDPEDRQTIEEVVAEQVSPLVKAQRETADENELRQVLTDHPEFKPFEKAIRKNMTVHTTMPILQLAYAVAGEKLVQIGGKKKADADKDAKDQNLGASTARTEPTGKEPDYSKMSREEFQKHLRKAKGQQID